MESDADLVAALIKGDARASEELYQRHHDAVLGYARCLVRDQYTAEDLTSEAFTRTLAALRQGGGPQGACRPYLYTVVRNAAVDLARTSGRTVVTDEVANWAEGTLDDLPDVDELDALVRAFRSLPERWQTVLWYTIIEDEPVQQVAELLGMEAGAVAQLSFRAREGLRRAFLEASFESRPECAEFTAQLAASVRRPTRRRGRALRQHLESCDHCRRTSKEMSDLNRRLRRSLPIGFVVLGAPSAPLAGPTRTAFLRGWAVPAGVAGTAAVIAAVLLTTIGGTPHRPPLTPAASPSISAVPVPPRAAERTSAAPMWSAAQGKLFTKTVVADAAVYRIRNATLGSCLAPQGSSVVQRSCIDAATGWRRSSTAGGFTLTSTSTGKCMSRGAPSAGVPWEGGTEYAVTTSPCGGQNQVWKLVQFSPGVTRLMNGDGYYLQASWSGLQPVTLKPSSFAGMAAQGWSVEHP